MNITLFLLDKLAKYLVGGVPFESAKRVAADLDNKDLTGAEKKEAAKKELISFGYSLSSFLLNSAIELAVIYIGAKAGKK